MKTTILFAVFALLAFSCAKADESVKGKEAVSAPQTGNPNPEDFTISSEGGEGTSCIYWNKETGNYIIHAEYLSGLSSTRIEKDGGWGGHVVLEKRSLFRNFKTDENYVERKMAFTLENCFRSQIKNPEYQKISKTPILEIPWTRAVVDSKVLDDGNNTVSVKLIIDCKKAETMEIILNLRKRDESGKNWVLKWVPDPDDEEKSPEQANSNPLQGTQESDDQK